MIVVLVRPLQKWRGLFFVAGFADASRFILENQTITVMKVKIRIIMFAFIVAIMAAMSMSCAVIEDPSPNAYIIEQGNHKSNEQPKLPHRIAGGKALKFKASFGQTTIYDFNGGDINKLYGMTSTEIHTTSARFGWRSGFGDETIEIFAYWYNNGQRGWESLGFTVPGQTDDYEILIDGSQVAFRFNGTIHREVFQNNTARKLDYRSYPYFGGDLPAPQRMVIHIIE